MQGIWVLRRPAASGKFPLFLGKSGIQRGRSRFLLVGLT
jgi:hypothetical protein